jgi:hypothetical protein
LSAGDVHVDCSAYCQYGELTGKTIPIYTGIGTPEDTAHIDSCKPFENCAGATAEDEGDTITELSTEQAEQDRSRVAGVS